MIGLLTIGLIGLALCKKKRGVAGIGRTWYGGNSGYDGYSMSIRAREAREEGRYPKTDFKRVYGINERELKALVELGVISDKEWHHTSKFGNRTIFYSWDDLGDDEYLNIWNEKKSELKQAIKNNEFDTVAKLFDVEYNSWNTDHIRIGDRLKPRHEWLGFGTLVDAAVIDLSPRNITYSTIVELKNGEIIETKTTMNRMGIDDNWSVI